MRINVYSQELTDEVAARDQNQQHRARLFSRTLHATFLDKQTGLELRGQKGELKGNLFSGGKTL